MERAVSGSLRCSREVNCIGRGRTTTYVNGVFGWLDDLLGPGVVNGKFVKAKWELNRLALAWIKSNASKTFEIAYRLLGAGASNIDVTLDDLGGMAGPRIGDRRARDHGLGLMIAHERS